MKFDFKNIISYVQPQFRDVFFDIINQIEDYNMYILKSGRASGKSTTIVQALIMLSFIKKGDILVLQSTLTAMRDASYRELCNWIDKLGLSQFFRFKTSPLEITNTITGQRFIFRGTDNPERIKGIPNVTTVWLEEADLVSRDAFNTVKLSIRSNIAKLQYILSFNPSSPFTWIKDYIDSPETYKAKIHHSYFYKNPKCNNDFIEEMKIVKEKDYTRFLRDGLGQFTEAEGLIINNKLIEDWQPNVSYGSYEYNFNGMDFGFVHPQVFVNGSYYSDTNTLVLNEVISISGLTNDEFITRIPPKYKIIPNSYADSASPDKIQQLNQNQFKFIKANKLNLKVSNYIEFINSLTKIVVHPNAAQFKREAGIWEYMPNTDMPRKVDDDINDAIRYGLQPILLERVSSGVGGYRINY